MAIHIHVSVVADGPVPPPIMAIAREALDEGMRTIIAPRVWLATPVRSGKTLRAWQTIRHEVGTSILNNVKYARWIRRGGLSRASFAILMRSLEREVSAMITRRIRGWYQTEAGARYILGDVAGIPFPRAKIDLDVTL